MDARGVGSLVLFKFLLNRHSPLQFHCAKQPFFRCDHVWWTSLSFFSQHLRRKNSNQRVILFSSSVTSLQRSLGSNNSLDWEWRNNSVSIATLYPIINLSEPLPIWLNSCFKKQLLNIIIPHYKQISSPLDVVLTLIHHIQMLPDLLHNFRIFSSDSSIGNVLLLKWIIQPISLQLYLHLRINPKSLSHIYYANTAF